MREMAFCAGGGDWYALPGCVLLRVTKTQSDHGYIEWKAVLQYGAGNTDGADREDNYL